MASKRSNQQTANPEQSEWLLVYEAFSPEHQPLREALCTLGNGYFATRGAAEEAQADEIHYPGTYIAGAYNRLQSDVAGHKINNEDLVNFPNWLVLTFRPEGGNWFNLLAVELLAYRQELNLQQGILTRQLRFQDHQGHETSIQSRRMVHMNNPHLAAIEYTITAENWSGPIEVKSALDGSVVNAGVARYRELNSKHLQTLEMGEVKKDSIYLLTQTNQSHRQVAMVARTRAYTAKTQLKVTPECKKEAEFVSHHLKLNLEQGEPLTIEKLVSIYTSKDHAISGCLYDAKLHNQELPRFSQLLDSHQQAWKFLWHRCDVQIKSHDNEQLVLRLHIFHLLQSVSMHSIDLDVGVPARGLHGEAYRGHVFWDELFIFPFYTYRIPEITRSLLLYRYRRLQMACCLAKQEGLEGAMYPWQSGSNGEEETQRIRLNPRSNTWGPDYSRHQRHVNIAIAFNIWQYYQLSDDKDFLTTYGAEMLLQIARFWSSLTTYNELSQRFEIHGVMGPDEYHEKYPDSEEYGFKNNAYTNVMVVWIMECALKVVAILISDRRHELIEQLQIKNAELQRWKQISLKMTVPFHEDHIISQFEGYEKLKEFDWDGYMENYGNIERLDRILKAEGDSPDNYKVSKQADVLMLFYLLSIPELHRIFKQLGYKFPETAVAKNLDYYQKRTTHGSTLSRVVHASVMDCIDVNAARCLYQEALESDISDAQGETTPEGIHLGAMAGTLDIVLRHYAGIRSINNTISFNPHLPEDVHSLCFRLQHRRQWYKIHIDEKRFKLILERDGDKPVPVIVYGKTVQLMPGSTTDFTLEKYPCMS